MICTNCGHRIRKRYYLWGEWIHCNSYNTSENKVCGVEINWTNTKTYVKTYHNAETLKIRYEQCLCSKPEPMGWNKW
jgi:hypothetical protein